MIVALVPEAKKIFISQEILKCTQNHFGFICVDFQLKFLIYPFYYLRMYQQLDRVKHFPPVSVSVIRDSSVVHVSHEAIWEF